MTELSPAEEQILEEVALGERSHDDPEVRDMADRNLVFAERLAELDAVQSLLDQTGQEQALTLAEAERVRRAESSPVRRVWLGVAALALVSLALWSFSDGDDLGIPHGQRMGNNAVELLAPAGEVASFSEFRWRFELPANGWFTLRVFDAESGIEIGRADEWTADAWAPRESATGGWPNRIRWTVEAYDANGQRIAGSEAGFAARN